MTDAFDEMVAKHRERMQELRNVLDIDGSIRAVSARDPEYSIILTKNSDPSSVWRVTSFRNGKEPIGHREYDHLESSSPINSALQEFAGDGWTIIRRTIPKRERDRRIKEAREGLQACADAITNTPDDAGKAIFERGLRTWQRRLAALTPKVGL